MTAPPLDWLAATGPADCRRRAGVALRVAILLRGPEGERQRAHAAAWDARAAAWAEADAERRLLAVRFMELRAPGGVADRTPSPEAADAWRAALAAHARYLACLAGDVLAVDVLEAPPAPPAPDRRTLAAGDR